MLNIFYGRLFFIRIVMLLAMFALVGIGIAMIYASGNPSEDPGTNDGWIDEVSGRWNKQLIFAVAGLIGIVAINLVDYRDLGQISYWIYAAALLLLGFILLGKIFRTELFGILPEVNGSRRWIRFGFIQIQPSEFCKIAYILALAWYLRYKSNYRSFMGLIGPFGLTLLAMVLILLQPDLGTVLLMMPILFSMVFVAGARVRHLLIIILLAVFISPFMWHFLKPYQKMRISCLVLQNKWVMEKTRQNDWLAAVLVGDKRYLRDMERNQSYQLVQAKRAISSAGYQGFGYRKGPFVRYNNPGLPERHNDFIFSLIAHQWGIWGPLLILFLYGIIVFCGIEIAAYNTDPFARLIAVGIMSMFLIQVIVNIGMNIGLMPITGITLPLISYGGSSLMTNMLAIGLLQNIGRVRPFSVAGKGFE